MRWSRKGTFLLAAALLATAAASKDAALRAQMVKEQIEDRGLTNTAVLAAMRKVPRHKFVPEPFRDLAYVDAPLAIGHGQTISQPYVVAVMTELLHLKPTDRVLEIGTGSGYQAAVLAEIAAQVYTIEIIEPLATSAAERLKRLGYSTVQVKCGDGFLGWPEHAPFDAIIVTCAVDPLPEPLIKQLKPGGRLVIPEGQPMSEQWLVLVEKDPSGKISRRRVLPVAFVPMTRETDR
ncbi:MAG TPA: protein-L-isoaspartate(D-aspartate) O-methyltransferase [Verrucomicrobiae bacterium]|nr:protein-L-isoaspartate(D-aspartate) O-methyltransferase [Verrucomicrobiae bacterium]